MAKLWLDHSLFWEPSTEAREYLELVNEKLAEGAKAGPAGQ
jgi:hypothetical protein